MHTSRADEKNLAIWPEPGEDNLSQGAAMGNMMYLARVVLHRGLPGGDDVLSCRTAPGPDCRHRRQQVAAGCQPFGCLAGATWRACWRRRAAALPVTMPEINWRTKAECWPDWDSAVAGWLKKKKNKNSWLLENRAAGCFWNGPVGSGIQTRNCRRPKPSATGSSGLFMW